MAQANPADHVGKVETATGEIAPVLAGMLAAALGHDAAPLTPPGAGAVAPPLWHWSAFPAFTPHAELGPDGHPRRGGFLPALPHLGRRMWAGGRLTFHGDIHVGEALTRRSEILSVEEKEGKAGSMAFVTVAHRIEGARGGAIDEEQDIVYLEMPSSFSPPRPVPAPEAPDFDETLSADPVRLFRYSAATFNGHRIHYDLAYAREVEKYPDLVVHGPLQASLLLAAAMRHAGRRPARFRHRGIHPMFSGDPLRLLGVDEGGAMTLCTAAPAGHQGMQAHVSWA